MDVVQARAATGSSPTLVDALTKGKGKGKKGQGEGKDPKSKDDKGKGKGGKNKARDKRAKIQDSKALRRSASRATASVHMKNDCQQRADMRRVTSAGRPFVDRSEVAALADHRRDAAQLRQ